MKNLIWHTETRTVSELVPNSKNPRKISPSQLEALKRSFEKYNLVEIPAIDIDGTILAGHQRIKILKILGRGDEAIDVRVPNRKLTDEESKGYLIGSNALGGDWDFELLKEFDLELLTDVGFSEVDLSNIWDDNISIKEESFDVEKELKNIKESSIKTGDIIVLGKHKVICGDSTDPQVIKRLFEDKKASMIYSDPIYNINLDYDKGLGGKQSYGGTVTDNKTDEEYKEFLRRSMTAALSVSKKDIHVFYWNTEQHIWIIQTLYRELGIDNKRVCLWVKNGHNPTPLVAFNKCYEPCIYGAKGSPYLSKKEQSLTEIMNKEITTGNDSIDEINLWTAKRVNSKDYQHATTKPVELHEKAIRRCTLPGDIILDSFLGSGSTLIAAEQLKRVVYGVEMEPVFCDLIINRYEKLTGTKAQIISYEKAS
ncbi:MAG: DNA modification methylase [Candidatus Pacebacteria bacterium]|nr:DNA modification methylase [Candidatus Paceibacterota bacterium]MBP9772805.1 DNA modification methylase [Candidatus Paceibacterota bacterium]